MTHQKVIALSKLTVITDWEKVARSVDAVIIRMGYRGTLTGQIGEDTKYRNNLKACLVYNLHYGLTFFSCAISEEEAIEEAEWIIKRIPNKSETFSFPLFIATDTTSSNFKRVGRSDNLSKEDRTRFTKVLCKILQKAGIKAGIYGTKSWLETQLDMTELDYPVWLIEYNKENTYDGNCILWQYSSGITVPGISGGVQMSKVYKDNNKPHEIVEESVEKEVVIEAKEPVSKEKKTKSNSGTVNVDADTLRIRRTPGGADSGKRIPNGTKISYTEIQNGFGKLEKCKFGEGWVNLTYVK